MRGQTSTFNQLLEKGSTEKTPGKNNHPHPACIHRDQGNQKGKTFYSNGRRTVKIVVTVSGIATTGEKTRR